MELADHNLVPVDFKHVIYEQRPLKDPTGTVVPGLYSTWVWLNNPSQLNSYTTSAVKEVILAMRAGANDRNSVAVVFTGAGDRAFCTGGNTKEYAEYYSGRPEEYRQYMRLFNDMVSSILECDKPVICRANGMRIGGGQEIGMACDFTLAQDMARFGQAGPKHGSAPVGGSTDFLPLFVGIEHAMLSCTACEPWSAHKALRLGLLTEIVPALVVDGEFVPNPLVDLRWVDDLGSIVYGESLQGDALARGKAMLKRGTVSLDLLDKAVDKLVYNLAATMPGCLSHTLENLRRHKLKHWDGNREMNRAWLGLNMVTEANAGFRAFNEGPRHNREADFMEVRRKIAEGQAWTPEFVESVLPKNDKV